MGLPVSKKGTPDTAYKDEDGWTFVECTTQRSDIEVKVRGDVEKCINPDKAFVPIEDIAAITYFSANLELDADSLMAISTDLQNMGIKFEFYGPARIADKIYHLYPHLAADFLNIEIGSREVSDLSGFLAHYKQRSNGIPIDNPFCLREKESAELREMLSTKRIITITGNPGVGKTKLATHVIGQFAHENSLPVICVRSTPNVSIADIERLLSSQTNAMLLIDDVNKLCNLESLMELIVVRESLRVVMTVRDYALQALRNVAINKLSPLVIENELGTIRLTAFSDREIEELARDSFEISDQASLQAIRGVSKGNPRLAAMASSLAQGAGSLSGVLDANALYESYFCSIESAAFSDKKLLTSLGLIALFSHSETVLCYPATNGGDGLPGRLGRIALLTHNLIGSPQAASHRPPSMLGGNALPQTALQRSLPRTAAGHATWAAIGARRQCLRLRRAPQQVARRKAVHTPK